jgi:hypothetical protein
VGSNPTRSIFINLVNYGIVLSLFLGSCRTRPAGNNIPHTCNWDILWMKD